MNDPHKKRKIILEDGRVILAFEGYAQGHPVAAIKVVHQLGEDEMAKTRIHSHRFYELVIVLRGRGFHCFGERSCPLRPGQVYLLFPGEFHHYEFTEPLTLLTFMFDSRLLRRFRNDLKVLPGYPSLFAAEPERRHREYRLDSGLLAELDVLLNSISQYGRANLPGCDLLQITSMVHVLILILQATNREKLPEPVGDIAAAVSYMTRHYHQEITLTELSRMAGLSVTSFYRKFCREFQEPPIQWLLKLRLRNSLQYLIRSDMTVAEIARTVGFSDPFYYSRQFRKILGCTPSDYRKRNHGLVHTIRSDKTTTEYIDPVSLPGF